MCLETIINCQNQTIRINEQRSWIQFLGSKTWQIQVVAQRPYSGLSDPCSGTVLVRPYSGLSEPCSGTVLFRDEAGSWRCERLAWTFPDQDNRLIVCWVHKLTCKIWTRWKLKSNNTSVVNERQSTLVPSNCKPAVSQSMFLQCTNSWFPPTKGCIRYIWHANISSSMCLSQVSRNTFCLTNVCVFNACPAPPTQVASIKIEYPSRKIEFNTYPPIYLFVCLSILLSFYLSVYYLNVVQGASQWYPATISVKRKHQEMGLIWNMVCEGDDALLAGLDWISWKNISHFTNWKTCINPKTLWLWVQMFKIFPTKPYAKFLLIYSGVLTRRRTKNEFCAQQKKHILLCILCIKCLVMGVSGKL